MKLSNKKLNAIDRKAIMVAVNIGGDDLLCCDGNEIIAMYKEHLEDEDEDEVVRHWPNRKRKRFTPSLSEALDWHLSETSANSFEILLAVDGRIKKVSLS